MEEPKRLLDLKSLKSSGRYETSGQKKAITSNHNSNFKDPSCDSDLNCSNNIVLNFISKKISITFEFLNDSKTVYDTYIICTRPFNCSSNRLIGLIFCWNLDAGGYSCVDSHASIWDILNSYHPNIGISDGVSYWCNTGQSENTLIYTDLKPASNLLGINSPALWRISQVCTRI